MCFILNNINILINNEVLKYYNMILNSFLFILNIISIIFINFLLYIIKYNFIFKFIYIKLVFDLFIKSKDLIINNRKLINNLIYFILF